MENKKYSYDSLVLSRRGDTFGETVNNIKEAVNYYWFDDSYKKTVEELCKIMADVLMLSENKEITIGREKKPISVVQEIYNLIDERHIYFVIEQFKKIGYPIRYKTSYLRTMLYNSVMELEHHYENEDNVRFAP